MLVDNPIEGTVEIIQQVDHLEQSCFLCAFECFAVLM